MLTFAVVVSRSGGPVSGLVIDHLSDRGCPDVPFGVAQHLAWSNDTGTVRFAGWQNEADETAAAHHWHVGAQTLTAFTGHLWPRTGGWTGTEAWSRQLAQRLESRPLAASADELAGVYIAMSLHRRGRGAIAADPVGMGLAYWGRNRDLIVISSRAALAARLLAPGGAEPKRDVFGAGWLAYGTRSMGLDTGFEGVKVVPEGAVVDIDPTGDVRLLHPPRPPWRLAPDDPRSTDDLFEETRAEMTTALRMALAAPGTKSSAGLTGGKDSRLILALLLADGTAGQVEFQTRGRPDLPDVIVARQIAERFGLRHVVKSGGGELTERQDAVRAAAYPGVRLRELSLRVGAFAASGSRNVSEPILVRPRPDDQLLINGLCGEMLRATWPATTRFQTKAAAAVFPDADIKFGTAGILRPEPRDRYRRAVHGLMFDDALESESPQDVVDAFYIRNWLRRWIGSEQEFDSQNLVFPLYSLTGLRLAFRIGAENRHADWIHYQLTSRASAPLAEMPFAGSAWRPGARDPLVPIRRYSESPPETVPTTKYGAPPPSTHQTRTVAKERRARLEDVDVALMRRFFADDSANPLFEIVDPVAANGALDGFSTLAERQKLQLYGALTAAIWLGGEEIVPPL